MDAAARPRDRQRARGRASRSRCCAAAGPTDTRELTVRARRRDAGARRRRATTPADGARADRGARSTTARRSRCSADRRGAGRRPARRATRRAACCRRPRTARELGAARRAGVVTRSTPRRSASPALVLGARPARKEDAIDPAVGHRRRRASSATRSRAGDAASPCATRAAATAVAEARAMLARAPSRSATPTPAPRRRSILEVLAMTVTRRRRRCRCRLRAAPGRGARDPRARSASAARRSGLILGSGLGAFADRLDRRAVDRLRRRSRTSRARTSTGHAGKLVVGERAGVARASRCRAASTIYEGHDLGDGDVPGARADRARRARRSSSPTPPAASTRAARPATLMLIRDHLEPAARAARCAAPTTTALGPRFPDMTHAYAPELRALAQRGRRRRSASRSREGVYAALPGPTYETPAEVRMLRALGADLAGHVDGARGRSSRATWARACSASRASPTRPPGITGAGAVARRGHRDRGARARRRSSALLDAILGALRRASEHA